MSNNLIKRFKFGVIAGLFALTQAMLPAQAAFASNTLPLDEAGAKKVYVCKYVGKPGAKERLKEGKNPIETSTNSLPAGFNGDFPYEYVDAHESSVAIGYVGEVVLTAEDCPAADQTGPIDPDPTDPIIVTVTKPYANDPTCEEDGTLVLPSSEAYHWTGAENGDGPGEYPVEAVANEGYELTGQYTWTLTVLPQLFGAVCEDEDEEEEDETSEDPVVPPVPVAPAGGECIQVNTGRTIWYYGDSGPNVRDKSGEEGEVNADGWDSTWRLYAATNRDLTNVELVFTATQGFQFTGEINTVKTPGAGALSAAGYTKAVTGYDIKFVDGKFVVTIASMPANSSISFNAPIEREVDVDIYMDSIMRGDIVGCDTTPVDPVDPTPPAADKPAQPQVPAVQGASTDAPRQAAQEDVYVLPQTGATDSANPLLILIAGALAYGVLYFAQPRREVEAL